MIANLLLVCAEDFPLHITRDLEKTGFSCSFSRGVLKTRQLLEEQTIDAILWLFLGHERALAYDLLKVFNRHTEIPIIFITQSYDELDFAEEIKGLFANLDLNDDIDDIIKTVETACNQSIMIDEEKVESDTYEIDFKNAVTHIIKDKVNQPSNEKRNPLKRVELWDAVDRSEKKILSQTFQEETKRRFSLLKRFGKKT